MAIRGERPPYVPWSFGFTHEAADTLEAHYGTDDLSTVTENHLVNYGNGIGFFDELPSDRFRDVFGVVWDRTIDKDIGNVEGQVLPEPTLDGYTFPDPLDDRFFAGMPPPGETGPDQYRVFSIGFSLYERAWALRGMTELLMDFVLNPDFVHELLARIADYNIAQVERAVSYDIDAVYFGDDWGQQSGLIFGIDYWREFVKPQLVRMYGAVRDAGKVVMIHSCGKVDELFDDLIDIGLNCFNPFQPEVMDVYELVPRYRGRLAFHGGLSTQQTLPYGTVADVLAETDALLELGADGGYIFSPAHAVEGDVPVENMVAFVERAKAQLA
jgi:uroporphyrinogen decarboxylase